MPTTVNGVGTHYYGKKNITTRSSQCRSCNRVGELRSYETRLWFVVVFIPVIPLGRIRILDQCPSCSRHYAMSADAFEQAKQLQTSGGLEAFRREPSVEAALAAHGQLVSFREDAQAAEFRQVALGRFPDDAALRAGMAVQLHEMSAYEPSARLYQEAFDLDPDLPEACVGVAKRKMAEGKLDEARRLLAFLETPGEGQHSSLEPINILAGYMQRAGRHQDAYELAKVLLREIPTLTGDHKFRTFVHKTEKAVGVTGSILPARRFSIAGLFRGQGSGYPPWVRTVAIGTVASVVLLGGMALNNEYIRTHRTLHVLNATGQAAQIQVDDQPAVTVSGLGQLTVAEGPHVVKVGGPMAETHKVALDSGYFERWSYRPVWIVNLGGESAVREITHVYSAQGTPGSNRLVVGQPFLAFPQVDYLFESAPNQLRVDKKQKEVVKVELQWVQGNDTLIFDETANTNLAGALDFAEKRLRRVPNQPTLLKEYVDRANNPGRIANFLEPGLAGRPVDVSWHRAYQIAAEQTEKATGLVPLYDKLLAAAPSDAALLYLRGRIEPDWSAMEGYYRRSIDADPKLGWPWLGLATQAFNEGKWDDTLDAATKARELKTPEPERIAGVIHLARLSKGEADAMVEEDRARSNANPADLQVLVELLDDLAAAGRDGEIEPAITAWVRRIPAQAQLQIGLFLKALGLYLAGNLEECAKLCESNPTLRIAANHFDSLVALGRMSEAADGNTFRKMLEDPSSGMLSLCVGYWLVDQAEESKRWRESAIAAMTKSGSSGETGRVARLLASDSPPSVEEIGRIPFSPRSKLLVLATLASKFPKHRVAYLGAASRFNASRMPPHQLIRRAIEGKGAGRP